MRSYITRFINNLIPSTGAVARDEVIENLESRVDRLERANLAMLRRMVQIGNYTLKDLEVQSPSVSSSKKKVIIRSSGKHSDELSLEEPTTTFH